MSRGTHDSLVPPDGRDGVLDRAMRRFIAGGLLVLLVISLATVAVARDVARELALADARDRGTKLAHVMKPLLNVGELESGLRTMRTDKLDAAIGVHPHRESVAHVKVWTENGHVVWSDNPRARGHSRLRPVVRKIFESRTVLAAMSDSKQGDGERINGRTVLEVHVPVRSVDHQPLVIESYWSADLIERNTKTIMRYIAPLALGALLLFALLVFPLARSLARRVHQAQIERAQMMQHALSASDLERRRIARDLHDGVMQELSGAGYALSAAAAALPPEATASQQMLDKVTVVIRDAGASLRSLLTDIYPTSLMQDGLEAAVAELAARSSDAGLTVTTDIRDLSDVPIEATQLSYRVVREGLHNVRRHAQARHAEVAATRQGTQVFISVADDGRGPTEPAGEESHLGLRLLSDTLHDVGGTLRLAPRPGGGAVLTATFSLSLSTP